MIHQMAMETTTIFKIIQSELMKNEHYEIVTPDDTQYFDPPLDFIWYDDEKQFTTKILKYDDDVSEIVNHLFGGLSLIDKEHDKHFKKSFVNRFVNRQINRQTIESFKMELVATFLSHEDFINTVYEDIEKYIQQTNTTKQETNQINKQLNDGTSTTDNRQAFADLPQSSTNLDVDNTIMDHATDNTISRNKQTDKQETEGETSGKNESENKTYQLDELLKSNGLLEQVYDIFDRKCFLQVW